MTKNNRLKIAIAQSNYIAGDIEYNSQKVISCITDAKEENADIIIFQKNTLLGFPIHDVLKRFPFLIGENKYWLNQIAKISSDTATVILGFCDIINNKISDCLAIIQNGKITNIVNDTKPFNTVKINNLNFGIILSSDFDIEKDKIKDIDIIIDCCPRIASNTEMSSLNEKYTNLSKYNKTIIFINGVGSTDNISYCGESTVYYNGKISARAKSFEEDILIYNLSENNGNITNSIISKNKNKKFSLDYEYDLERTYKIILQGIKDYFNKNGLQKACLGLSGGLDSTVCAVLLVDALGAENVYGVSMPSVITSKESKTDAKTLAENLNIGFVEAPIKNTVKTFQDIFNPMFKTIEKNWNNRYKKSFTLDNIQARTRATYLWGISNEFESCIPIATSDKSESYMGYATINGDMSGGFAPIADVTKTKLFALAEWLNKNRPQKNVITESVIKKRPGAELAIDETTGKPLKAEDALMPYEFLDEIIWRIENNNETFEYMLNDKFLYECTHKISFEQKKEWIEKFYKRMKNAVYKWTIMPPAVILDTKTINSYLFKYPISSNINFQPNNKEEFFKKLTETN